MRLTLEEIEAQGLNIDRWLFAMKKITRMADAPVFELKGPCQLVVRKRNNKSGSIIATASGRASFTGGEKFRIGSITATREDRLEQVVKLDASFVPADMAVAAAISGMTLPLDEAFSYFEGFEDFIHGSFDTSEAEIPAPVKRTKRQTLAEQRDSNPMWGSW